MKNILFLVLVLGFVSCGGKSGSSEVPATVQNPVRVGLNTEEVKLLNELTEYSSVDQKKVLRILLKFEKLQSGTLKKLDQHINIDCSASKGLCQITKKAQ
jgi:hypothetical protein